MKTIKRLTLLFIPLVLIGCRVPIAVETTPIDPTDTSQPMLTQQSLSVIGVGGHIFDLERYETIQTINIDQGLSLVFNAQDRGSGVQSIRVRGEFRYNCGVGSGTQRTWEIDLDNTLAAEPGERVRVAAGVSKMFKIRDVYDESDCDIDAMDINPPFITCTLEVTAMDYMGNSGTENFRFTLIPTRGANDLVIL
ncbi:hypothetical protein POV27_00895 [Aureisphaera galaxeae]|uniref:hypothetical protein n=1 Tax=Aureisphaera galaxeae TaxID=1538023 RepID=UPI002350AC65|nr:hypothetical protein [Aureisphaera galaxeae]MDC8002594.1 hypothetical protein [Aureisphaera galaxeae]